jgi:serine protease Do
MINKRFMFSVVGMLCCLYIIKELSQIKQLRETQEHLQESLQRIEIQNNELRTHIDVVPPSAIVADREFVAKSEVWRTIQDQIKDTVVQVFAQIAEVDLLSPYKAPSMHVTSGSGFFINERELITNAHVVNQAYAVWVQVPSLGKTMIDVEVVGVSERDVALLRIKPEYCELIKRELGRVPFLPLGNSDQVRRSDEVLALGYPLGQQSLKSTTGVISGREQSMIQISAPINPGSSGGPLLNVHGEVVGINTSGIVEAQNVGYIIPINDVKNILADLQHIKLLRTPFLGILCSNATEALTEYLGNPLPGGCYLVEVIKGSTLHKAGIQRGDMIYEINGYRVDMYGEMNVPWSEDKISIIDYITRLSVGQQVHLVAYRKGQRKEVNIALSQAELPPIRKIYPGYEPIEYEVIAGMVIMPLTLNHVHALNKIAPGLMRYTEAKHQEEPALIITTVFPTSQLYRSRTLMVGSTLLEINGMPVHTLDDVRNAIKAGVGNKFLTIKAADNLSRTTDHLFVALPLEKVLEEEPRLARDFKYTLSDTAKELLQARLDVHNPLAGAPSPRV